MYSLSPAKKLSGQLKTGLSFFSFLNQADKNNHPVSIYVK
jgi:hypothetical protein